MKTTASIRFLLHLGANEMDRTHLSVNDHVIVDEYPESILPGDSFKLSIPSGSFTGAVESARQLDATPEEMGSPVGWGSHSAGQWEIVASGQWAGKRGGLVGGLSGRGTWTVESTSNVTGTFGPAATLAEYDQRAEDYRARFIVRGLDADGMPLPFTLTLEGEREAVRFLAEKGNPVVGWSNGSDNNCVGWEWDTYTASLPLAARFLQANCTDGAGVREFGQWLDQRYASLRHYSEVSEARGRAMVGM